MYLEREAVEYFRQFEGLERIVKQSTATRSGAKQTRNIGRNLEFEEFRTYSPGDDLRDLDWRKMARTEKLYIKKYGSDISATIRFLLDTSLSMDYPQTHPKIDIAKKSIALLSSLLQKQNHQVKLDILSDKTLNSIPLFPVNLEKSLTNITPQEKMQILSWRRSDPDDNIFLLTDLWYSLNDDSVISHLLKNRVNLFLILSREEIELPFKGYTEFLDLEEKSRANIVPSSVRKEYQRLLQQKIERFRTVWLKNKLVFGLIRTDIPYYVQLKKIIEEYR